MVNSKYMKKLKSFAIKTTSKNLLKDLKKVNHMSNAKKLKVKKTRAKKEIIQPKVEYPSLSENYEEDLERAFINLNPDNELIDLDEMLEFDKQVDKIVAGILFGILIFGIGLILIFI
jgi:hypothetical protein